MLAITLLGAVLSADPSPWCATGPETERQQQELRTFAEARTRHRLSATSPIRQEGSVFVISADESNVFGLRPLDLIGSSIRLTPSGDGFTLSKEPLQYDEETGGLARRFSGSTPSHHEIELSRMSFPFGGEQVRRLYISELMGIFLSPPPVTVITSPNGFRPTLQYHALEAVTHRQPVIAPLLQAVLPPNLSSTQRELFIRESDSSLLVTWRTSHDVRFRRPTFETNYDVQARLGSDGSILFSYRSHTELPWGTMLVTTQREGWRRALVPVGAATDAPQDARGAEPWRSLMDIRSVSAARISGSELIEFRVEMGTNIRESLPTSGTGRVTLFFPNSPARETLNFTFGADSATYCIPAIGCSTNSNAASIEGNAVVLRILDRNLSSNFGSNVRLDVFAYDASNALSDSLSEVSLHGTATAQVDVDLSELSTAVTLERPILESFTLPALVTAGVWQRLRGEMALPDGEVDAVAIYQSFATDIILYAGAYATGGNNGADGVRYGVTGSRSPKTPTLLHMNRVDVETALDTYVAQRLLGHEFGHRWLTSTAIREDGAISRVLNPASSHPAQYVHLPAAVPIRYPYDSSAMGGGFFRDNGDGSFTVSDTTSHFSYSWLDLYLMGLAAPGEVPSFYYIAGSEPALGREYYPPARTTVRGTRKEVSIEQVVSAMGPRLPAADRSQKQFRVLFVLLEAAHSPATPARVSKVQDFAREFESWLRRATLERAHLNTQLPVQPSAAFRYEARGTEIHFYDQSAQYPSSWSWSFGDGTTSALQHPSKSFAPGRHRVTLTVRNSRGESSVTQEIVVSGGSGRRRAVGR